MARGDAQVVRYCCGVRPTALFKLGSRIWTAAKRPLLKARAAPAWNVTPNETRAPGAVAPWCRGSPAFVVRTALRSRTGTVAVVARSHVPALPSLADSTKKCGR